MLTTSKNSKQVDVINEWVLFEMSLNFIAYRRNEIRNPIVVNVDYTHKTQTTAKFCHSKRDTPLYSTYREFVPVYVTQQFFRAPIILPTPPPMKEPPPPQSHILSPLRWT